MEEKQAIQERKKDADSAGVGRGHGTAGDMGGAERKVLQSGAGNKREGGTERKSFGKECCCF